MSNSVNPEHYNRLDPQPKEVIRKWDLNFNLGSAVKYISRAGHKDDIILDLKKAQEFIQFEIDAIEEERAQEPKPATPKHPNCKCIPDPPYKKGCGVSFEDAIKHCEEMDKEKHKETVNSIIKDIVAGMDGVELMAVAEISDNEGMIAVTCKGELDPDDVQSYIKDELIARLRMMK